MCSVQVLLGLDNVPFAFEGLWAVWLVHVYTMYVYFYLFVASALRQMDPGLLEASADMGATGIRTFTRVVLPHLRPALIGASLLVFMVSMASFTAPLLFAGNEHFLTLQIFNYKTNGNLDLSAAMEAIAAAQVARHGRAGELPRVVVGPSRQDSRTRLAREFADRVQQLDVPVSPAIGQRVEVAVAASSGRLVRSSSPAGDEFRRLARHVWSFLKDLDD